MTKTFQNMQLHAFIKFIQKKNNAEKEERVSELLKKKAALIS
jgi:hypothetical protein